MRYLEEVIVRIDAARVEWLRKREDRCTPPAVWDDKSLIGEGEEGCSTESTSTTPD